MTTPAAPLVTSLARRWRVDVDTNPAAGTSTWVQVRGIRSLTPAMSATLQDDSDFDSDGWTSQVKTMLAWSLDMTVKRGKVEGVADPGQEVIRLAAQSFGDDGVVHVRWYERDGGDEAYEGYAEAAWDPSGGAPDALDEVSATLTGKGVRTAITNPAAA